MKVFAQGNPRPIDLTGKDFRARGGQGAIYVKGKVAYKIFGTFVESPPRSGNLVFQERHDWALPLGRIGELATITVPEAVKPEAPLLDGSGTVIGHTMRAIEAKYVLAATLPRVFRDREGLKPDDSLRFVRTIQAGIKHAHGQGFRLVDIQPNNFLLSEDYRDIYFIDVDSWATPHYPALALIESARDWVSCPTDPPAISNETDWFSFAVLAFEILVGIHPFKGKHPSFPRVAIRARMEARKSVLNREVRVDPDSIMPLSVIPPVYRDWFEATFEQGLRIPPPEGLVNVVRLAARQQNLTTGVVSSTVKSKMLRRFRGEWIATLPGEVEITSEGVFQRSKRLADHEPRSRYAVTPRGLKPMRCRLTDLNPATGMRALAIDDLVASCSVQSWYEGHDIVSYGGRVLLRVNEQLLEMSWFEATDGSVRAAASPIAQVSANTTRLYPGVALQQLLGATYATLLPVSGGAYEVRLRELEGVSVLDARLEGSVLQVAVEDQGTQRIVTFRFQRDFKPLKGLPAYDAQVEDVTATGFTGLNFAVLDTGVCVESRGGELRIFAARPGPMDRKTIPGAISTGAQLLSDGSRLLAAGGGEVAHLTMT